MKRLFKMDCFSKISKQEEEKSVASTESISVISPTPAPEDVGHTDEKKTSDVSIIEVIEHDRQIMGIKVPLILSWVPASNVSRRIMKDTFRFERTIGHGGGSHVYCGVELFSGDTLAVKRMPKAEITPEMVNNEATMLYSIDHPGVIRFHNAAIDEHYYYLMVEYASRGSLLDFTVQNGNKLAEIVAASIIREILLTVGWLHRKDVVHRDLKLENVVFTGALGYGKPILIDFAMAMVVPDDQLTVVRDLCGTPYYAAPEKWRPHVALALKAGDMWAIGVMAYAMVLGYLPFHGKTPRQIRKSIDAGVYSFREADTITSPEFKVFVSSLLVKDYVTRMDVKHALKHPWVNLKL